MAASEQWLKEEMLQGFKYPMMSGFCAVDWEMQSRIDKLSISETSFKKESYAFPPPP